MVFVTGPYRNGSVLYHDSDLQSQKAVTAYLKKQAVIAF